MNQPYQLIVDIWEGNIALQPDVLKQNGVAGMIVRLNQLKGGLFMDDRFTQDWQIAQLFPVRAIYNLYNPWVDGATNLNWLMSHLPPNYSSRVFLDVEVIYAKESPKQYADGVAEFIKLCKLPLTIYTGQWFMEYLSVWPLSVSYWWAAYPSWSKVVQTWAGLQTDLNSIVYQNWISKAPANVPLWQAVGDNQLLPGFGNQKGDVSIYPGTLDDLETWINGQPSNITSTEETPDFSQTFLSTENSSNKLTATVLTDTLNVRPAPSLSNVPIAKLSKGAVVPVLDVAGQDVWLKTPQGWICAQNYGQKLAQINILSK